MREALMLLLFIFSAIIKLTSSTVLLKHSSTSFPDLPAKFALALNSSGICGVLEVADPLNACSPLRRRFESNETEKTTRLALIVRGECVFEDKIRNAQNGGFRAAIVFDDRYGRNLVHMMVNPEGIKVHAVFVSKAAGEILKAKAEKEGNECCIYPALTMDRAWTVFAISLLSLIVILALLLIAFITPRHWLHWVQTSFRRKSMDVRMVESLHQFIFSSARLTHCHSGETCAICLEDYKDGEVLKLLPCHHEFHSICVDSWLNNWGTFCPVCRLDMRNQFADSKT